MLKVNFVEKEPFIDYTVMISLGLIVSQIKPKNRKMGPSDHPSNTGSKAMNLD